MIYTSRSDASRHSDSPDSRVDHPIPPLYQVTPLCPMCLQEVVLDGRKYVCQGCRADWPLISGSDGLLLPEPGERRCTSTSISPHVEGAHQCLLGEHHVLANSAKLRVHVGPAWAWAHTTADYETLREVGDNRFILPPTTV